MGEKAEELQRKKGGGSGKKNSGKKEIIRADSKKTETRQMLVWRLG